MFCTACKVECSLAQAHSVVSDILSAPRSLRDVAEENIQRRLKVSKPAFLGRVEDTTHYVPRASAARPVHPFLYAVKKGQKDPALLFLTGDSGSGKTVLATRDLPRQHGAQVVVYAKPDKDFLKALDTLGTDAASKTARDQAVLGAAVGVVMRAVLSNHLTDLLLEREAVPPSLASRLPYRLLLVIDEVGVSIPLAHGLCRSAQRIRDQLRNSFESAAFLVVGTGAWLLDHTTAATTAAGLSESGCDCGTRCTRAGSRREAGERRRTLQTHFPRRDGGGDGASVC
jgi:hypothetical protein